MKKLILGYFIEARQGESITSTLITKHVKSFLTHNEASIWRRGLTNSDLVGRALLASG